MFSAPATPPPMIVPPQPNPPPQMQATGGKPTRQASQPTFISEALAPPSQSMGIPSLVGGTQAA